MPVFDQESFAWSRSRLHRSHYLVGNGLYQAFKIGGSLRRRCGHSTFDLGAHSLCQFALIPLGESVGIGQEIAVTAAKHVVAAHVAILALEAGIVDAEPLLEFEQFLRLLLGKEIDAAQLTGEDQHLAVGIQDFRVEVGRHQVLGKGDGAVVRQDDDAGNVVLRPFSDLRHSGLDPESFLRRDPEINSG